MLAVPELFRIHRPKAYRPPWSHEHSSLPGSGFAMLPHAGTSSCVNTVQPAGSAIYCEAPYLTESTNQSDVFSGTTPVSQLPWQGMTMLPSLTLVAPQHRVAQAALPSQPFIVFGPSFPPLSNVSQVALLPAASVMQSPTGLEMALQPVCALAHLRFQC
jgi:hypothetical protein